MSADGAKILNIVLIVAGGQPVYDRLQNGSKVSILGTLSIVIHTALLIHSEKKLKDEQEIIQLDKILFAMTYLQRIGSLGYPLAIVICSYFQFGSMCMFLNLQNEMDFYLESFSADVPGMYKRIKRREIEAVVVAVIGSFISCASAVITYCDTFTVPLKDAQFYSYYTGAFFTLNFVAILFKMSYHYYSLDLRFEYFNAQVQKIMNLDRKLNVKKMRESSIRYANQDY